MTPKKSMTALLLAVAPLLAAAAPTAAADPLPCTTQTPGGDYLEFTCPLPQAQRNYRFRANFGGGHDDTKASMEPSLGEVPLDCAEGSKTRLFAEEGDISLECRFAVPAAAAAPVLKVTLLWTHAEYAGFELFAE